MIVKVNAHWLDKEEQDERIEVPKNRQNAVMVMTLAHKMLYEAFYEEGFEHQYSRVDKPVNYHRLNKVMQNPSDYYYGESKMWAGVLFDVPGLHFYISVSIEEGEPNEIQVSE